MLGTSPWPSGPDAFLYAQSAGRLGSKPRRPVQLALVSVFSLMLFAEKSILQTQLVLAGSSWGRCSQRSSRCGPDTPPSCPSEGAAGAGRGQPGRRLRLQGARLPPCLVPAQVTPTPRPTQGPAGAYRALAGCPPTILSPQSGPQTSPSSPVREDRGLRAGDPLPAGTSALPTLEPHPCSARGLSTGGA